MQDYHIFVKILLTPDPGLSINLDSVLRKIVRLFDDEIAGDKNYRKYGPQVINSYPPLPILFTPEPGIRRTEEQEVAELLAERVMKRAKADGILRNYGVQLIVVDFEERVASGVPASSMNNLTFDIVVDDLQPDGRCNVHVNSPAGSASARSRVVTEFMAPSALEGEELRRTGMQLYEALFREDVRDCLNRSIGMLHENQRLSIRLELMATELQRLPWEALYDARHNEYLALTRRFSIVRYIRPSVIEESGSHQSPYNLLVVVSGPADLPQFDVQQTKAKLRQALRSPQRSGKLKTINFLKPATFQAFRDAFQKNGAFHFVHFIGHGGISSDQGFLVFERDTTRESDPLDAEMLASFLKDIPLRFVFLTACESGAAGVQTAPSGVAYKLVNEKVAVVLAMQFAMPVEPAIAFACSFYKKFAQGMELETCVTEARIELLAVFRGQPYWVAPVVVTRALNVNLFG